MGKVRLIAVAIAIVAAAFLPLYFMFAALGSKFGIIPWQFGLGVMIFQWSKYVLFGVLAITIIACLLAFLVQPRGGRVAAVIALAVPVLALFAATSVQSNARKLPPIHDISTDLADRPVFSEKALAERGPEANPLDVTTMQPSPFTPPDLVGKPIADLQKAGYPDVQPLPFAVTPDKAFEAALAAMQANKLKIVNADKSTGVVEGVAETFWFGFKDDVVVRVRPTLQGSVIDIRSASRVGLSDLGTNAKRIKKLQADIKKSLQI
jgi:fatty-acyl-CoA synthase